MIIHNIINNDDLGLNLLREALIPYVKEKKKTYDEIYMLIEIYNTKINN